MIHSVPDTLATIPVAEIEAARARLDGIALRTPLVRLGVPDSAPRILLKLENLQPIGSFKLRGAANAMAIAGPAALAEACTRQAPGTWPRGSPGAPGNSACVVASSSRRRRRRRRSP